MWVHSVEMAKEPTSDSNLHAASTLLGYSQTECRWIVCIYPIRVPPQAGALAELTKVGDHDQNQWSPGRQPTIHDEILTRNVT